MVGAPLRGYPNREHDALEEGDGMSDETIRRTESSDPATSEATALSETGTTSDTAMMPGTPGAATTPETETTAEPATSGTATTTAVDDSLMRVPEADERRDERTRDVGDAGQRMDLLDGDLSESFRRRWADIQAEFVDRPRESVEQADRLVLEVVDELQTSFTTARERLESQWSGGDEASTEDLRLALQRYRSFFARLLAA
jgi:hypothetical protein